MKSSLYPAQELRRRALAWSVKLRVSPRVIRVQNMRRKWGSCSTAGTVTLASELVEREERFQDYVIVHELLHLRIPSHGRLFSALLTAHVPGWRAVAGVGHGHRGQAVSGGQGASSGAIPRRGATRAREKSGGRIGT